MMRSVLVFVSGLLLICCLAGNLIAGEIHEAAKAGDLEKIKSILEADQSRLSAQDKIGYTALHWAAMRAKWDAVRYLVDSSGADVNAYGVDGCSPLHSAANHGNVAIIGLLIKKGSVVDLKNNLDQTPLHITSKAGNIKVAQILAFQGANVNAVDNNGWTPLYYAQKSGHTKLAGKLKRLGGSLDYLDSDGKNADEIRIVRPKSVEVELSKLEKYAGKFSIENESISNVWIEEGKLWVERYALHPTYPIGVDSFYCEKQPWTISFSRNEDNEVDSIYFELLKQTVSGVKVDNDFELTSAEPKLGITVRPTTRFEFTYSALKAIYRLESPSDTIAATVTFILENSPADRAGIKQKDVILMFNNNPIMSSDELYEAVKKVETGTYVPIEVLRQGNVHSLIIEFL
ncbi:MAG: PDZ domain-containing protein [candidate division Zixibacteria bacterium]|nr:PDZ domain-containing protein [candidate division Zixibacteria bacterium]